MVKSKTGFILSIIGGVADIFFALLFLFVLIMAAKIGKPYAGAEKIFIIVVIFVGILFGILMIIGEILMNKKEQVKKGAIIALVSGILSGGNLFGIIGGAIGLSDAKKIKP